MIKQKFKIEGMHCSTCALSIDFDLEEIKGVKNVKTSYAKNICEIEFDEEVLKTDEIIRTISKTGYRATLTD